MKTLSQFLKPKPAIVSEELNDYQKGLVDDMSSPHSDVRAAHDKVFGQGNERIILPYDDSSDTKITTHNAHTTAGFGSPANKILGRLEKHGYVTDDYASGLVHHEKTPTRKIKISKALSNAGIDNDASGMMSTGREPKSLTWAQSYAADPIRAAAKGKKQIVISRHPHDVAGMSSGRGWGSCMTLPTYESDRDAGANNRYLTNDLAQGTLTAYLTKHGDDKVESPIGRVNIKPFIQSGKPTIYRPEGRGYGAIPPKVKENLSKWATDNYPSENGIYVKHPSLYNDDGDNIKIEKNIHDSTDHNEMLSSIDKTIHGINREGIRAADDEYYRRHDNEDEDLAAQDEPHSTHFDNMVAVTRKLHDSLPAISRANAAAHYIAQGYHRKADDIDSDDHYKDADTVSRIESEDYSHSWGKNNTVSYGDTHKFMSDDDAYQHHVALHDAAKESGDYIHDYPEAGELHANVIRRVMNGQNDSHKNSVIHHVINPDNDSNVANHYSEIANDHELFDNHIATHTPNPRTIHTILEKGHSGELGHINPDRSKDYNDTLDGDGYNHIGEHADMKLAHAVWHGHLGKGMHSDDRQSFIEGLNNNPEGEKIQHALTDRLHLSGGNNRFQHTTFDASDTTWRNGYDWQRTRHNPVGKWVDEYDDKGDSRKLGSIAEHTNFKSVFDKLKTREDTRDVPELKDGVKNNHMFESTQKTLKSFMSEAKKETKRSIAGELIKKMDAKKKRELGITVKPDKEKTEVVLEPTEADLVSHEHDEEKEKPAIGVKP